jgi:hypothetical protein
MPWLRSSKGRRNASRYSRTAVQSVFLEPEAPWPNATPRAYALIWIVQELGHLRVFQPYLHLCMAVDWLSSEVLCLKNLSPMGFRMRWS